MFYTKDTGDIEFNRRNMISTTNWLVNIDKRLTLKQILPHLKYLQDLQYFIFVDIRYSPKYYIYTFPADDNALLVKSMSGKKFDKLITEKYNSVK